MIRKALTQVIWIVLLFLIFFTPLAIASNRPTPLFLVQLSVLIGLLTWFCRSIFSDHALSWHKTTLNAWLSLFLFLVLAQLAIPAGWPPLFNNTFYVRATLEAFLKTLTYLLVFWLTLNFIQSERQMTVLIRCIFILGFIASLIGIIGKLSGAQKMLWFYEIVAGDRAFTGFFSTFVNRDHFASFIGMVVLMLLGRFLYLNARYSMSRERKHREEKFFLLFVLVVSSVSLFMSLSRGGMIIFILSLFILYRWILVEEKRKRSTIVFTLFVVFTFLMLLWIGLEPILSRLSTVFGSEDLSLASRMLVWQNALSRIFPTHLFTGSGLGTFQYIFPGVESSVVSKFGFWRHAHSDWIELLLETGIVGFSVVLGILFCFFREVLPTRSNQSDPYIKYNGSGAIAAIVYILLMSSYDFPLRTTACAVYFSIIAAFAVRLRQFQYESEGINRVRTIPLNGSFKRLAVGVLASAILVFGFAGVARPFLALRQVLQGGKDSIPDLEKAIALDPLKADYHFWLGLAMSEEAFYGPKKFNDEKMKLAFQEIEKAIKLNPNSGKYPYGLAFLSVKMGDNTAAETYFQKTLGKEPNNPFFQIYYSIFCFNQAMVQSVLYDKDITTIDSFQKGLSAYRKAKEILPNISLADYKKHIAAYDNLNEIVHRKGLINPNTLL